MRNRSGIGEGNQDGNTSPEEPDYPGCCLACGVPPASRTLTGECCCTSPPDTTPWIYCDMFRV
ncbi:hypothetical protein E2C01_022220 [Portunus trituberculatus]|uniref:Uncharacterized protein n=1 Tax=Portunus trituberculatus TaxID=210409 RepID=A0A5B7E8B7_PORTR|nr:hypothetical protein [Portunus trituberculatus]